MKKIILAVFLFGVSYAELANATVGGSTYIYNFKYNPENESVYYISVSEGGRGCPPEIMRVALSTEEVVTEFDCGEMEKLLHGELSNNYSLLDTVTKNIIIGYKDLIELNLNANKISFDVKYASDEMYGNIESADRFVYNRIFDVSVYQNNVKVDDFQVKSCSVDTPFNFAGYIIPGFEKKIAVLVSGGSDCVEGPYTVETMKIVSGVQIDFRQPGAVSTKKRSALIPSEKTLTVRAADEISVQKNVIPNDVKTATSATEVNVASNQIEENSHLDMLIVAVLAIFLGFFVGRATKKDLKVL